MNRADLIERGALALFGHDAWTVDSLASISTIGDDSLANTLREYATTVIDAALPQLSEMSDERLAEIRDRWSLTTQGPWFWWGNTDSGNEALCGRQPGLGVCEVLSTIDIERTAQDSGAREYREFLSDATWGQPDGSFRHLTDEELEEKVREDWLTDSWDQPRSDRKLALTNENHIRRAVAEVAVYQVARAQGMPEDTPRTDPHVYRADICDVRNPNGRALAASWSDVRALLAEVERLQLRLAEAGLS